MSTFIRSIRTLSFGAALGAVGFAATACGSKTDEVQIAADSTALTPPPTPAVAPPIADVPVTPAKNPTTTTKAPAPKPAKPVTTPVVTPPASNPPASSPPAAPAPVYGVVSSGSEFIVHPASKVCTNTQKVGDHIVATLTDAVSGSAGVSIPSGATADLEVTKAQFGNNDEKKVALDFRVVSVSFGGKTYDVTGDVTPAEITKVRRQSTGDQAKKVAIGAAAGAVVGRVLGGNTKSTVVGGAIGGVAGAATAAGTADYDGCVAPDSKLTVKLTQDLRIRVS